MKNRRKLKLGAAKKIKYNYDFKNLINTNYFPSGNKGFQNNILWNHKINNFNENYTNFKKILF